MAAITITVANGAPTTRVLDALATKYGYTGFLADGITAQTKAEFAKAQLIKWVKAAVKEHEANTAAAVAANTANADADLNIVIT